MKKFTITFPSWMKQKAFRIWGILVIAILLCSLAASIIQSNAGSIDIEMIKIVDEDGNTITGKMYRPRIATELNPAPGVIACHGMNNDKDTEAPVALELAKRGIVVIAVDQQNHGDSDMGMNIVGEFLKPAEEESNDTIGANAMYVFLQNCDFVDSTRMGIIGHSMGGSTARTLARLHPDHRAVIIQAGGPDNLTEVAGMHNYLDIWSYYEELFIIPLESRADYIARGKAMITYNTNLIGEIPRGEFYDETYGTFALCTAQRYALCYCTHPAVTWNLESIRESVAWMLQALKGVTNPTEAMQMAQSQTYLYKEYLLLTATVLAFISLLPFAQISFHSEYFAPLITPLPSSIPLSTKKWWQKATVNTVIGGVTYIVLPLLGMILGGILTLVFPVFRLLTGNGFMLWLLINALICSLMVKKWVQRSSKTTPIAWDDLGIITKVQHPSNMDSITITPKSLLVLSKKQYLVRTFLLVGLFFLYLQCLVTLIQSYLSVELRFMWPVLKMFTPLRFGLFLVYLIPVYAFFKWNAGIFMFGTLRMKEYKSSQATQWIWYVKYLFALEAGLLLTFLIQYLPMFLFKTGPGLSMSILFMFFGLFGIFLMQALPQFALLYFLIIVFYRKTGKIYVGAFTATMLLTWIIAVSGQLV